MELYPIEKIKSENPLEKIVSDCGIKLIQRGGKFVALCPFHKEKTESFEVDPKKQLYHCFGCGAGGDVITFVEEYRGLSRRDALNLLTPQGQKFEDKLARAKNGDEKAATKTKEKKEFVAAYDYTDEQGKLLHQTLRYAVPPPKNKTFRQRRPDALNFGKWIWSLEGIETVIFRLPKIIEAVKRGERIVICEGEKDVNKLVENGFEATCNAMGGGKGKWKASYNKHFTGADVVVIVDKDESGRIHAREVAASLFGIAKSLKVIELPDTQSAVKDAFDFFTTGGTKEQFLALMDGAMFYSPPAPTEELAEKETGFLNNGQGGGDAEEAEAFTRAIENLIILPSESPAGIITHTQTATALFTRIAPSKKLFTRGGAIMYPKKKKKKEGSETILETLLPAAAQEVFEDFANFAVWRAGKTPGERLLRLTVLSEKDTRTLLASLVARQLLPEITGLINCPVLTEIDGQLKVLGRGHDDHTGLFITNGTKPVEMSLYNALAILREMLDEFAFQTPGDRSRAFASLISPALKLGGFIADRVPCDVAEANESQSGKTYRQACIAAIYNETIALVSNKGKGGVGSIEEAFNQKLVSARPFIQFDNFRGKLDSQHLEAFLTHHGSFGARVPYHGEIEIDPSRFFIFLSSNGVDTTRDFMNRSSVIRILKRHGYRYKVFEGGLDLRGHITANQPLYLGAVFAVIKQWCKDGKQRTKDTRHDFREWCQILDWIVQFIFGESPLMDGHQEAQERASDPIKTFARNLAIAIEQCQKLGEPITATELWEICDENNIAIPTAPDGCDSERGCKIVGAQFAKLFKGDIKKPVNIDGFAIHIETRSVKLKSGNGYFEQKGFCFSRPENELLPHQPQ